MGTLDTVQQEQLRAIGAYLSEVRQEQDRTLEEIAAKTYIPLRLLKAIEAGQDKTLPEPVFIQGFIRRYADILGLDGLDLSHKFPVHVTPLPVATGMSRDLPLKPAVESSYAPAQFEDADAPRPTRLPQRSTSWTPYLAAAALLALGGIALGVVRAISTRQPTTASRTVVLPEQPAPVPISNAPASPQATSPRAASPQAASPKPASPKPASPEASPTQVNRTPSANTARSPQPSPQPTLPGSTNSSPTRSGTSGTPNRATQNAPVSVSMNLTGESWVQVVVDGEVKAEGVLPKGTQQNWAGQEEITIVAGNAGAVSVAQNGGAAKALGALGDVSERRFVPRSSN